MVVQAQDLLLDTLGQELVLQAKDLLVVLVQDSTPEQAVAVLVESV
jgi:hypothetical protein